MSSDPGRGAGHVCLAFDSRPDLEERARDFLAEGAASGALTWFIAAEAPATSLPFVALSDTYADGVIVDPPAQVAAYAAATEAALAAGHTGLWVVADATPLVRTPAQLDAFARYEFLVDRYIRGAAFTAMCAYNRAELGDDVITQLACMHSDAEAPAPFQLHACPPAEGSAALTGELDLATDDLLSVTLRRTDLPGPAGEVVLQAGRLRFADHGSLLRLQQFAAERDTTVVLRDASPAIARLAELLDLSRLRVEVAR
jgi:hypothetical protein